MARVRDQRRPRRWSTPRRPTLSFTLDVEDRSGREVFAVALTIQIQLEPIKRSYDDETRESLVELFGETGPMGDHRANAGLEHRVRAGPAPSRARRRSKCRCCATTTSSWRRRGTSARCPTARCRCVWHFNGSVYYQGDDDRLQIAPIPWDTVADYQMPVAAWREMIDSHYPHRGWVALDADTVESARPAQGDRGSHTIDQTVSELLDEAEGDHEHEGRR